MVMDSFGNYYTLGDSTYSFSQQQKDFIKLQFKYGVTLKRRLEAGTLEGIDPLDGSVIPANLGPSQDEQQAYYNSHLWLAQQTLSNVDAAYWQEFGTAIQSEDLQWLAGQIGEDVGSLATYVGKAAGTAVGGITSGIASGVTAGLGATVKNLSLPGWLLLGGAAVIAYFVFVKSNPIKRLL